jgi:hypothetical protein
VPGVADIIGTLGVALIVVAYVLLQVERLRSDQLSYSLLNAVGAAMILVSLYYKFNFAAFLMELTWLLVSLFGVVKFLLLRRAG